MRGLADKTDIALLRWRSLPKMFGNELACFNAIAFLYFQVFGVGDGEASGAVFGGWLEWFSRKIWCGGLLGEGDGSDRDACHDAWN